MTRRGYEACLKRSIDTVVRQQAEAGIDIVSDGEFSKGKNWAFYIHDRLGGIARRPLTPEEAKDPMATPGGGQDQKAFPEFYAEYNKASGLGARLSFRIECKGKLKYTGQAQVRRDIANLKAAVGKAKVVGAFLPVVAPASALPGAKFDGVYKDEQRFPVRPGRGAARGIQGDRRCRPDATDRRRLPALYVREDGAADDARRTTANGPSCASTRSTTRSRAFRRRRRAITSAGAAGTARTCSTCR